MTKRMRTPFCVNYNDNFFFIEFEFDFDLDSLRKKLPTVKFTLVTEA